MEHDRKIIRRGPRYHLSDFKKNRIVELASQGRSISVIAERLGLSPNTVYPHWRKGVRHDTIQTKVNDG